MTMTKISSMDDLRNYVDAATTDWLGRTDQDVEAIVDAIQASDHPPWGTDWSEFLTELQERNAFTDFAYGPDDSSAS
jgi:hypothetical protein